jgi:hypothetical protein
MLGMSPFLDDPFLDQSVHYSSFTCIQHSGNGSDRLSLVNEEVTDSDLAL